MSITGQSPAPPHEDSRGLPPPGGIALRLHLAAAEAVHALCTRAMPHGGMLAVGALFLLAGILVFDDYGVGVDEPIHRDIAMLSEDYALGRNDNLLLDDDRIYGVAFGAPLLFAERLFNLEDSRDVYLFRHLGQHLFFLVSGIFCYALVYRLFNNRSVALLAMILFIFHPRLYGASFFNALDMPFLSMFMITLFFIHRSFRRDTAFSFLLCGVAVGLLVNIRIVGVLLFAVVVGLRLLDFLHAPNWLERRRVLLTGALFALVVAGTVYATWPYLWADPIDRFIESWERFARHDDTGNLFGGVSIRASEVPLRYIPTWFAITTAPVVLALGVVGAIRILARSATGERKTLANTPRRFALALVLLCAGPVLGVWLIGSLLYDGWRHLYFLYAPFLLLAAFGIQWLSSILSDRSMILKAGGWALAVAGIGVTLVSTIRIHPHQNMYFNFLVDRTTPNALVALYEMDHYGQSFGPLLTDLLDRYPESPLQVSHAFSLPWRSRQILPETERSRLSTWPESYDGALATGPDFRGPEVVRLHVVGPSRAEQLDARRRGGYPDPVHTLKVYNNAIYSVLEAPLPADYERRLERHHAMLREAHRATLDAEPLARSAFDVWLIDRTLVYRRDACPPLPPAPWTAAVFGRDTARFFLHVVPASPDDLAADRREHGFENRDFDFWRRGGMVDGSCVAITPLPDYAIASVRTGQFAPIWRPNALNLPRRYETVWGVDLPLGEAP